MFKNPFSFEGRIRRTEFGLSLIIYLVAYFIIIFASGAMAQVGDGQLGLVGLILFLPAFWFFIAQAAKRCHDVGSSGWYQLIPFYNLYILFADGEAGANKWGPNPKGEGNHEEINEIGKIDQA
ncbi:DUF805 domain-containing protein [Sungkyunkwania multivorans]|uniref:DUF805 domain-containing protein n=1 Tax=Sungkyunkwania multivorans TaxID=1173618 RepID=A0ABW3CZ90_9FLAO